MSARGTAGRRSVPLSSLGMILLICSHLRTYWMSYMDHVRLPVRQRPRRVSAEPPWTGTADQKRKLSFLLKWLHASNIKNEGQTSGTDIIIHAAENMKRRTALMLK
jgi:hypothetical protein